MAEEKDKKVDNNKKVAKKQFYAEKKQLKEEQKNYKKNVKERAKQISTQESELYEDTKGSAVATIAITIFIVIVWLGVLAALIKLDVGGFGTEVLTPILKDIPIINKVLPNRPAIEGDDEYFGYASLKEAVERIKELELELEKALLKNSTSAEEIVALKTEIERLLTFESNQVEFQRIKTLFYDEVIYAENGPGPEEYQKFYESIDPTTAAQLYKQVLQQLEESTEIIEYAGTYSAMKPKEAAAIFEAEALKNNLDLVARILDEMSIEDRGGILGAMDPEIAALITKLMEPSS